MFEFIAKKFYPEGYKCTSCEVYGSGKKCWCCGKKNHLRMAFPAFHAEQFRIDDDLLEVMGYEPYDPKLNYYDLLKN